jgi:hypothetical protein
LDSQQELGTCGEWDVFLNDRIPTTLITHVPISLSWYKMEGDEMLRLQNPSDPLEIGQGVSRIKCEQSSIIANIIHDLRSFHSSSLLQQSSLYQCGATQWSVLKCSQEPNSVVFCLNCTGYCNMSSTQRRQLHSVSCLNPPSDPVGTLSGLYFEFNELSPPPSILRSDISFASEEAANVTIVLSDPGYLVCGAYPESSVGPASSQILLVRSQTVAGSPLPQSLVSSYPPSVTIAVFPLANLFPSTSYEIYCASLSPNLVLMPTVWMMQSKMSLRTSCCRSLSVKLNTMIMDDVSAVPFALTVNIGSHNVDEFLKVFISAYDVKTSQQKELFVPSVVSFTSISMVRKVDLTYIPSTSGVYRLNISITGPSSADYEVMYPVGRVFTVKGTEESIPPPQIQRSEFSADGSKVIISFDSPTNRGGMLSRGSCDILFESSHLYALSTSRCVWKSDISLEISSFGSSLDVDDVISLKSGALKARCTSILDPSCSTWSSNSFQNTSILSPKATSPPDVSVSIPNEIGPCDNLMVDLTASSGSGGRIWKSFSVVAIGLSPNISLLQNFFLDLSSHPLSVNEPITIPNKFFTPGYVYSLEITLCNFLNSCGTKIKSFVVTTSHDVPVVFLNSQNLVSLYRNSTLSVMGDAYVPICDGSRSNAYLTYTWSIFENEIMLTSSSFLSVSVNPRVFQLPPYRLTVGSVYTLKLTVKHLKTMKSSFTSLPVFVKTGDLKCVVSGGEELGLRVGESLYLDLSKSYDTDLGILTQSSLHFEWDCFQLLPSYRQGCSSLVITSPTPSNILLVPNASSSPGIMPDDVFQFVIRGGVVMSSSDTQDDRSCEISVRVLILSSLSPVVRLDAASGSRINPSSKLKIIATIEMSSRGVVQWSVDDPSVALSAVAISPLTRILSPSLTSPNVFSLVIPSNILPEQSTFIFSLSCVLDNGHSSSSRVIITTNSPPFGGALEIKPSTGVMLETIFVMVSTGWIDEDLPLSYQFGYLTSTDQINVLRSRLELAYTSSLLPSASPQGNRIHSNLSCVVNVFDQFDSISHSIFEVDVRAVEFSLDDLNIFLLSGMNSSALSSNPDDLKNVLSSTTDLLNRVNCSNSLNCESLNRMDCSVVEGTCGDCLPGHIGISGSSNTICLRFDEDTNKRQLSSTVTQTLDACNSDLDCSSGSFLECNFETKTCQSIQKSCPNSCSGHGKCVFYSKIDGMTTHQTHCGVLDLDCESQCECDEGFLSSSCSLSSEEMTKELNLRQLILESLDDLMATENPQKMTVISWMKSLSSVASDDQTLNLESKLLMTSLAIQILRVSHSLGLTTEDLSASGMNAVLDLCISSLDSTITTNGEISEMLLIELLTVYSTFVTSDMSEDQYPITTIASFLRSSSLFFSSQPSTESLTIPQTQLESFLLTRQESLFANQQSIELLSGLSSSLQMTIFETQQSNLIPPLKNETVVEVNGQKKNSSSQLSSPFFISFPTSPCSSSPEPCLIQVNLLNRHHTPTAAAVPSKGTAALKSVVDDESQYFDVNCVFGKVEDHRFVCPSGDEVILSCNGSFSGTGRKYCSLITKSVDCKIAIGSENSGSLSCSATQSNASMTTCVCNLSKIRNVDSVSFSILSIEKSMVTEFTSTWTSSSSLSSSEITKSWVVLTTLCGLLGGFLVVYLVGMRFDLHQKNLSEKSNQLFGGSVSQLTGKITPQPKSKGNRRFVGVPSKVTDTQRRVRAMDDMKLLEESLPSVFKSDSFLAKMTREMKVYHRWLGIVFYYSPVFTRSMRVLSIFSSIVIMLFIQSVTYNIADPDDGSCEACDDQNCCLSLKSTLNSQEDRCYWTQESSDFGNTTVLDSTLDPSSCHFRSIDQAMTRMFIVAVISSVISAPFALSVQYLIGNILSRETLVTSDVSSTNNNNDNTSVVVVKKRSTRRNVDAHKKSPEDEIEEICGSTLQQDLQSLLSDITWLFQRLSDEEKSDFQGTSPDSNLVSSR